MEMPRLVDKATISKIQKDDVNQITFKVNGALVKTSGWNISQFVRDDACHLGLNITTNMHDDGRTILINLNGTKLGAYHFSKGHTLSGSYGHYKPDYSGDMLHAYSFVSGSVILTEVNEQQRYIDATFSGTVKDATGQTLEITEGKITHGTLGRYSQTP